jgi:hypothetical protein
MDDWISDLLIFSAGVTGGILVSIIVSFLRTNQRQRTDLAATRTRILADIKEQHEQEMLHAAVRTAEDIRGELHQSALTLQKALLAARAPVPPMPEEPRDHTADVERQAQSS